jgi:polysaccharide pyruvyl transferase WcaK-like protein
VPRRIGILGHVGNQNLGDEAIIAAVIQNVRDRIPAAELTGFTTHPDDTGVRHGIPAYPIRRLRRGIPASAPGAKGSVATSPLMPPASSAGPPDARGAIREWLRRVPLLYALGRRAVAAARGVAGGPAEVRFLITSFRRLRRIDLLIVAGSNQLSDYYGGPWGFPYTLFKWSLLARLGGARVAYLSVGAGPIRSLLSRILLGGAVRQAAYRSYRDGGSREAVAALGLRHENAVAPDLAHSLRFERPHREPPPTGAPLTVGINPVPYFDARYWAEEDAHVYDRYVDVLAAFAAWLQGRGHVVRFFPTQLRADAPVIEDVRRRMQEGSSPSARPIPVKPSVGCFKELLALIAEMDLVVAGRFHGIILAHLMGKPTIGIAYRRSTVDLFDDLELAEFAVDIRKLTVEGLAARLTALESHRVEIAERLARRMDEYRETLGRQYDRLLGFG